MRAEDGTAQSAGPLLGLEEARKIAISRMAPLEGYEQVILKDSLGRILFEDIDAPRDLPQETQSSMDGYAFNSSELKNGVSRFRIAGTSWAGRPYPRPVGNGECIRIFTGAVLPPGTDSVVIQENVRRKGDIVEVAPGTRGKDNLRLSGDEFRRGQQVLGKGKRLSPADLGILASLGFNEIRVRRIPRVTFFSTGDELLPLDRPIESGMVYDSNRYTLYGMLKSLGIAPLDLGMVRDDRDAILETLVGASSISDVILTSGGVSVGEADFVKQALAAAGRIEFWKIAMKPGKPLAFGWIEGAHYFGLPGNPVSVFVTFYQIVRPALLRMMGAQAAKTHRIQAWCRSQIVKTPGRQEFQRGELFFDECGKAQVVPAEKQQSHHLSAMSRCDCFIVLPAECEGVPAGGQVEIELIDSPFHFM